jgi:ferredoxin--NADP+ reductase
MESKVTNLYPILYNRELVKGIHLFEIEAPEVAQKARAGQFIIVRIDEKGERIPLTIAGWDKDRGIVVIVFQEAGTTTKRLAELKAGDNIADFVGPLGIPSHVENFGEIVCVAGGVGVAPIVPIATALKAAGNRITSILGARNKELVFWENELRQVSDYLTVTTDDGSYGQKGLVTDVLKKLLTENKNISRVIAVGPVMMMKFTALTTQPFNVPTIVSLNPIMVDGTGMCGACRVSVGGVTRFTCVDGPEFDGHQVNWDELIARQRQYLDEEKVSLIAWHGHCAAGKRG